MAHDSTNLVKSRRFGSVSRKAVMLVLADYTDAEWSTFVGQKRAAAESEVSERTVRSVLADFEREGLISRTHRGRQGDRGGRSSDRIQLHREAIERLPVAFAGKSRIQTATDADSNGKAIAGEQSEEPTSPNGDTNGLFEAFYEFWFRKPYKPGVRLTGSLRGRINKAVKEAEQAGLSVGEVVVRGRRYRAEWPDMERTPQALLLHWERFAPEVEPVECDECDNRGVVWFSEAGEQVGWDDFDAATAYKCQACSAVPGGEE